MKEVESLKDTFLLGLPVSPGDPVTGGLTAPSACVYQALCVGQSLCEVLKIQR